jgi:hypothetical protein
MPSSGPERHSAGERNRRKALNQVGRITSELEHIRNTLAKLDVNLRYAIVKAVKLRNRLKSEKEHQHGHG